jgi:hypothetical protein
VNLRKKHLFVTLSHFYSSILQRLIIFEQNLNSMVREESNAKIDKIIKSLEKGFDVEKLSKALMDLREDALKDEDPLLAKVLRLASEYMLENEVFDHTVEKEEDEEGEEHLIEPGSDAENLTYLMYLLRKSENKFNREEIKEMRTFLKLKLY